MAEKIILKWKKLLPNAVIPVIAKPGDACFDFCTVENKYTDSDLIFRTGLAVEIPFGYGMSVSVRSSTPKKYGIMMSNAPGIIDSGYRGELIFIGTLKRDYCGEPELIPAGTRLFQGRIFAVYDVESVEVQELSSSVRGEGGFGSTGK